MKMNSRTIALAALVIAVASAAEAQFWRAESHGNGLLGRGPASLRRPGAV